MNELLTWLGITLCVAQSACFSGLNLAVFSLSRLRLEAAADAGEAAAVRVLELRRDANFTLVTILLGNVSINVLLTLLAESVLAGLGAFLFSTVVITAFGEILPQAYFTRHALRVAALLAPLLRFYRLLLWPIARPVARLLDRWVGPEGMPWFGEGELQRVLRQHADAPDTEVAHIEAVGAINFLALDDVPVGDEGEAVHPASVLPLPIRAGRPVFPDFEPTGRDPFLRALDEAGTKWCIITDEAGRPHCVVNAHSFLRGVLFSGTASDPASACHQPLVVTDAALPLGDVLGRLSVRRTRPGDDVVDEDLILVWTDDEKRIITGADILGRLLRGISRTTDVSRTTD
jgi:metal transporter CNNM